MSTPSTASIKPGVFVVSLLLTAATAFVVSWSIAKGWKSGQKA